MKAETTSIGIIAEIGINHNGSTAEARALIEAAATAGVHAVKFQYRNLDKAYADAAREIGDEILLSEIRRNYLAPDSLIVLAKFAQSLGLQAGSSFFDADDMCDFGEDIACFEFFKLPSVELCNSALVDAMLATRRHVYLSTGCHLEAELESALSRLPAVGWTPMHCTSNYPATLHNAKLGYLRHLQRRWSRDIGYSSHDDHWEVCLLAMQLGATVIERHITFDKGAQGLDHSSSSTPDEFARLVAFADNMDLVLAGDGPRVPNQGEWLNRQNLGRSFFAVRDMGSGDVLSAESLAYRSPNIGINRTQIDQYLGKVLANPVQKGAPVTRSAFKSMKPLATSVLDIAHQLGLSLPVRLHDMKAMQAQFPIGAYEFHLSFEEVRGGTDVSGLDPSHRYSIHLPDYVSPTLLMDPFATDQAQRAASFDILERTVVFAERLQELTGRNVPVVGSFSVVHSDLEAFFSEHAQLLGAFSDRGVAVLPQWLPPIAWYFGGSVRLAAMNDLRSAELIASHCLPVCMDVCHLFMGSIAFGFSAQKLVQDMKANIRHLHIADAAGIDGEGLAIGEGEPGNLEVIRQALNMDGLKVIEVWQGHLDNGAGFRKALLTISELYDDDA
jgi:N-acetylneuraminate synthase